MTEKQSFSANRWAQPKNKPSRLTVYISDRDKRLAAIFPIVMAVVILLLAAAARQ